MSLCVKTLYHVFPQIKAFGCCHEVFGTQKLLAQIAESELGIADIKRDEIIMFQRRKPRPFAGTSEG